MKFDVHVTVRHVKFIIIKPTRCNNFLKFILGMKLYMFRTVPLSIIGSFFTVHTAMVGHAVAQLVEALRYKSEGRGFDSQWCHWNFSLT